MGGMQGSTYNEQMVNYDRKYSPNKAGYNKETY